MGGTVFLGRHLAGYARERGHEVTLFNRGSHPDVHAGIEQIRGDRRTDLARLAGRKWDAVFDTSGYVPWDVSALCQALRGSGAHYTFVSSISVYSDFGTPDYDESRPVQPITAEQLEAVRAAGDDRSVIYAHYGPLKAACERAAEEGLPGRALVLRPGLIVGPYDPSDRFTWWVQRVARGGEVLAPGRDTRPVQIIDVRDLAEWMVKLAEARTTGIYQATGPERPLMLGEMLDAARQVSGSDATFEWVGEQFLLDHGVTPWSDLPLWMPEDDAHGRAIHTADVSRARRAGLEFRPLSQTVSDTLEWDRTRNHAADWKAGLTEERERELLAAWHAAVPARAG